MFPKPFEYFRPESSAEAIELLEEHENQETKILSGGHSLLPLLKSGLANPDVIIDIGEIDAFTGVDIGNETVHFGGLTTYAEIERNEKVGRHCPVVAKAAREIGDMQVRNRGTFGGNIAHADPASDLPAAVLASRGLIHAIGPEGERRIGVDEFFLGMYATALDKTEIITGIEVPIMGDQAVGAYVKKASPSSGYAIVGVAVILSIKDGVIQTARVAANGAFDHTRRLDGVESALTEMSMDTIVPAEVASSATQGVESHLFMEDLQTSSAFRGILLEAYTERAVRSALNGA